MFLGSVCYGSDLSELWCQACFVIVDNVVYEAGFKKNFALKKGKKSCFIFYSFRSHNGVRNAVSNFFTLESRSVYRVSKIYQATQVNPQC